jgi:hypothetical protein
MDSNFESIFKIIAFFEPFNNIWHIFKLIWNHDVILFRPLIKYYSIHI